MCDRECDCKTCRICCDQYPHTCGDCYYDSFEQCRNGGIHNCRGYIPNNFFKRLWYCLTGKLFWWQLK